MRVYFYLSFFLSLFVLLFSMILVSSSVMKFELNLIILSIPIWCSLVRTAELAGVGSVIIQDFMEICNISNKSNKLAFISGCILGVIDLLLMFIVGLFLYLGWKYMLHKEDSLVWFSVYWFIFWVASIFATIYFGVLIGNKYRKRKNIDILLSMKKLRLLGI